MPPNPVECNLEEFVRVPETVLREDLESLSRGFSTEELIELWNTLRERHLAFLRNCGPLYDRETDQRVRGLYRLAMLLVASALREKSAEVPEATGVFREEEYELLRDFEEMKELDYLDVDEIVEFIERREGKVYEMVKKYYERQYHMLDTRWKGIMGPMALAFADRYRERRAKIEEAVIRYIRRRPLTLFIEEVEEAVIRSLEGARTAKKRADNVLGEISRMEEQAGIMADNVKVETLARAQDSLEAALSELKLEKKRVEDTLSLKGFRDFEREALEAELETLRARIAELEEALEKTRMAMESLEEEKSLLEERLRQEREETLEALEGSVEGHVVTRDEAWALEEALVQRTLRNLGKGMVIYDPRKGRERAVEWSKVEQYALNPNGKPRGLGVRLVMKRGLILRRSDIIVEVVSIVHPEPYRERGWDSKPARLGEVLDIISDRLSQANREDLYHILVVSSPTGFTEKAIQYATNSGALGFASRNLTLYLVDPIEGRIYYNENDTATRRNKELAEPRLPEERVQKVIDFLVGKEARKNAIINSPAAPHVTSEWVSTQVGEEPHIVRRAMAVLEQRGLGRVRATQEGVVAFFYTDFAGGHAGERAWD